MWYGRKKEFAHDMKDVYTAPTRQAALAALKALDQKWGSKYTYAIKSWR
jgi:putative transposase